MNDAVPSPVAIARSLVRAQDRGSLSTTLVRSGQAGHPYGSLVLYATAADLAPLLLLSDLADHTRNLAADPRAALLVDGTGGLAEPLTGPRLSLVGRIERVPDSDADSAERDRFLRRHPSAALYAGFGDFHLYRLVVDAAHLVAGFGRIHWLAAADLLIVAAPELGRAEADILQHMNQDHADAVQLLADTASARSGVAGAEAGAWIMTGVDGEGADFRRGGEIARIGFDKPAEDAETARIEIVRLVKRARAGS